MYKCLVKTTGRDQALRVSGNLEDNKIMRLHFDKTLHPRTTKKRHITVKLVEVELFEISENDDGIPLTLEELKYTRKAIDCAIKILEEVE